MTTTSTQTSGRPDTGTAAPPRRTAFWRRVIDNSERFGLLVLLAVEVVTFSLLRPETFATLANWQSIASSQAVLAVAALALMPALLSGRFDVSIGGILGVCSIACGAMISKHEVNWILAIVLTLMLGGCIGLFNGVMVAYFGVNSIIGTLGMGSVLGGLIIAYTHGQPISEGLPGTLTNLGAKLFLHVPTLFIIMLVIAAATWLAFTQTPFGRRVSALGSNISAARLSGIPVKRVMALSFTAGGVLAAAAGVLMIGQLGSANPNVGSLNEILPALAAVFLGATTWRPGEYTVMGTLIALFFVGTTISGLALLGTQPWVTDVFNGSAVIVAIAISAQFRRHRTGALAVGE
jgi:ribose transport system permease protein